MDEVKLLQVQAQNTDIDPKINSEVGVMDSNGEQIVSEQRGAFQKEIEMYENNIKTLEQGRDRYKDQWDIEAQVYAIRLEGDNAKAVSPKFKYEQDPRYWKLVKKITEYEFFQEKHQAESRLSGYEQRIKDTMNQLNSTRAKLAELEAQQTQGE